MLSIHRVRLAEDRATSRAGRRRRGDQDGFTLLELLVVLGILVLLAAVAVPEVVKYLGRAKSDTARVDIQNISAALDLYRLDVGRYPSASEGLIALVEPPPDPDKWDGPYLKKSEMVVDPWDYPYQYRFPGEHGEFDLYTLGADNAEGGDGEDQDIVSW